MFKGNATIVKYKQFTHCLQFLHAKRGRINTKLSSIKPEACFKGVFSIFANKLTEKWEKTKDNAIRLHPLASAIGFRAAISVFKTDPVTVTGYNTQDYDFLRLLGIFESSSNDTDEENVVNVNSDAFPNACNEQQESYSSIFDNMPTERNDLSTVTANFFNNNFFTPLTNFFDEPAGDGMLSTKSDSLQNESVMCETSTEPDIVVEPIPEPPEVPDAAAEAASQLNALGEHTFEALGLGGWSPVGLVQHCFEYLHVGLGIPWWEAIVIGTLVIRCAMFPLVIMAQRNGAKMNNTLPQMQVIQMKITEARQTGNHMDVARYTQELMQFMKEKQVNPLKNMLVPLAQMPIFVSFFMGLRGMANVPVESMRSGGMFWFSDLTVPDQYFGLPIITTLTLAATIELGTDSARLSSQNLQTMKYVMRALPFVILPFTVNFPSAILCYWVSSNFISLVQVGILRIPAIRDFFKIEPMLNHEPQSLPMKNKGFVGGIKDSWTNLKITKELEERRRLDEMQFQRAGKGPLVKTYKYDPTKQVVGAMKAKSAMKNS